VIDDLALMLEAGPLIMLDWLYYFVSRFCVWWQPLLSLSLSLVPGENIGIIISNGDMRKYEVNCREWTKKRHSNCSKIITQSCVPFVWNILTTCHGMKWEKQVLAAITTLRGKVAAQWNKSTVMAFPLEDMMNGRWKMFLMTCVGNPCNCPVCRQDVGKSAPSRKLRSSTANNDSTATAAAALKTIL
jgi:hypothetical protein